MKIKFLIAAGVLALTACNSKVDTSYNAVFDFGPDAALDGSTVYIIDYDKREPVDSAVITGGKAEFSGDVATPLFVLTSVNGRTYRGFILEPGDISVDYAASVVTGGQLNDAFNDYMAAANVGEKYQALLDSAATDEELNAVYEMVQTELDSVKQAHMEANIDNPIGLYLFLQQALSMEPAELKAFVETHPQLKSSSRVAKMLESVEKKEATSAGKKYADFEVEYDGTVQRLSDYVKPGQYTLVDFWASWCGPCRREIKVIKGLYDKYAGKGLDVVGVAVWDEPDATRQAIEEDGIAWSQILNAQRIPTDLYGINGIPCIMLVGPDGTIIARDLFDEEMVATVDSVMALPLPIQ